jgi:hypothetical protein
MKIRVTRSVGSGSKAYGIEIETEISDDSNVQVQLTYLEKLIGTLT